MRLKSLSSHWKPVNNLQGYLIKPHVYFQGPMFTQGGYGGNRGNMGNNDRFRHGVQQQRDNWVNISHPLCQILRGYLQRNNKTLGFDFENLLLWLISIKYHLPLAFFWQFLCCSSLRCVQCSYTFRKYNKDLYYLTLTKIASTYHSCSFYYYYCIWNVHYNSIRNRKVVQQVSHLGYWDIWKMEIKLGFCKLLHFSTITCTTSKTEIQSDHGNWFSPSYIII